MISLGAGRRVSASSNAIATIRESRGFVSPAKQITARRGVSSLVSASACRNLVPDKGSTRLKVSLLPPRPRIPVAKSWSRQSVCLALKSSSVSPISSKGFTTGAGSASTVNGPVIRTFVLSISGWSYCSCSVVGSPFAIFFSAILGTVL